MLARIGVDVGGTFTDISLFDQETGKMHVLKVPSTLGDQSVGITEGISTILESCGATPSDVVYLAHGTTVATNALLEHKGARVGLITTQGFRDLLEIGRQKRPKLYDLFADKPEPIVPRALRREVTERLYSDGAPVQPLDEEEVAATLESLAGEGLEALAVCFLHAYLNPVHEVRVRAMIEERFPDLYVCASHEVVPEFREYERFSTTVLNAYLGPVMRWYITNLGRRIATLGIPGEPYVTQSNGGIISLKAVIDNPVRTALSGPAAGVVGAAYVSSAAGFANIITFDMGGTSTDVCLVKDGTPSISSQRTIAGHPVRVPMVGVHTIGAGGGSIAWMDAAGALQVGPESAGSRPGPAAYGRGGEKPTVADANVVLGRLNPRYLLAGQMAVDYAAAERVIGQVAGALQSSVTGAAMGILRLVNSNMTRAVRAVSVEKGEDPRSSVLVAFGGAGPVHAAEVAAEIGMQRVLIPSRPGILCAMGLLATDIRADYVRSRVLSGHPDNVPEVNRIFTEIGEQANEWLDRESIPASQRSFVRSVDMRYSSQNFELSVLIPDGVFTAETLSHVIEQFHREHEKSYGYRAEQAACNFINFRVVAVGDTPKFPIAPLSVGMGRPTPDAIIGTRPVYFPAAGGFVDTTVYDRDRLLAGDEFTGPAIIEQLDTTTVVPPGCSVTVDSDGNLILEVGEA